MTQRQPRPAPSEFSHFQEVTKVIADHDFRFLTTLFGSANLSEWQ
jgi:hypothetical protein